MKRYKNKPHLQGSSKIIKEDHWKSSKKIIADHQRRTSKILKEDHWRLSKKIIQETHQRRSSKGMTRWHSRHAKEERIIWLEKIKWKRGRVNVDAWTKNHPTTTTQSLLNIIGRKPKDRRTDRPIFRSVWRPAHINKSRFVADNVSREGLSVPRESLWIEGISRCRGNHSGSREWTFSSWRHLL